jgi:PAS domain S-box-containing protein
MKTNDQNDFTDSCFGNIIECFREPITVLNTDLSLCCYNKEFAKMMQFTPNADQTEMFTDYIDDQESELVKNLLIDQINRRIPVQRLQLPLINSGKAMGLFQAKSHLIEDPVVGKSLVILISMSSECNYLEKELRESEAKYRALINSSNDSVWVIDSQANILDVNDTACTMLEYSREELLSMNLYDIDHSLKPEAIDGLLESMSKDLKQLFETSHRTKDGKVIPVEISSSLVTYVGKTAILSVARDISERKKAEEYFRYQHSFNLLVSSIASKFVKALKEDLKSVLDDSLKKTCEFFGVDRSYIHLFSQSEYSLVMKNKWFAPGLEIADENLRKISLKEIPWFLSKLRSEPYLYIDTRKLPPEATAEGKASLVAKAKTVLFYPLQVENRLLGVLTFAYVREYKEWSQEETLLLGVIAQLVAEAVNRSLLHDMMIKAEQQSTAMAMIVTAKHEINQTLMIVQGHTELLREKINNPQHDKSFDDIQKAIDRIKGILESMAKIDEVEFTQYIGLNNMVKLPKT